MKKQNGIKLAGRLRDRRGMSRIVGILLILIIAISAVIFAGYHLHNQKIAREIGCMTAMDTANRQLADAYLFSNGVMTKEQAIEAVRHAMNGWDDLCPGGGTVYMLDDPDGDMPYKILCGMHCPDTKERTRANANYVYETVCDRVSKERAKGIEFPESVTMTLNGEELTAVLVSFDQELRRGTYVTDGVEGVVAYYGISGYGEFADGYGLSEGEICYFCFADENHCAARNPIRGWYGDAWGNVMVD